MKPFDLSAALAGAPVCTRDGREVTQLHKFDGVTYGLVGVSQGQLYTWSVDGVADTGSCRDLCMAPTKKTGWVARNKCHAVIMLCASEDECRAWYPNALSYHQIEWED